MAGAAPVLRADYRWFCTLPTRWADNDQYGHMNNVVHYSLFDTAITHWQMGQGFFDVRGDVHKLVVVQSGCTYLAEAAFPDTIHAGLRLGHLGRSSWRYDMALFANDADSAFATGFFTQVLVDAQTNRPTPLPDATRQKLNALR